MKTKCWFIVMLSTAALAQPGTNPPAAAPGAVPPPAPPAATTLAPAATNAPAAAPEKKKSAKKKSEKKAAKKKDAAAELKTVPLVAGPAVVIASNVNVRGQARLNSEVITRVSKGQPVTVIEEIT